jgi:hypothetical protein
VAEPLGGAFVCPVDMTQLYPDIRCPACGERHALYHEDRTDGRTSRCSYVCPRTAVIVVCRPAGGPRRVAWVPDDCVPIIWLAD